MLGLGSGIGGYVGGYSDPSSFSGLALWLGFNQGVAANKNSGGTSVTHSTTAGNMAHNDKIHQWDDKSGNSNHAVQTTKDEDRPRWDTSGGGADTGAIKFSNNAKFMNLTSNIELTGAFTIMMRVRFDGTIDNRCIIGNSATDVVKIVDADKINLIIGGSDTSIFEDTSATDIPNGDNTKRQIITVTRDGSNNLKVYVNGGTSAGGWNNEQDDVDWDSGESHTDSDTLTIGNIGTSADDTSNHNGHIYDVLVYDGTVLNAADRKLNYDYLNSQTV